MQNCSLGTKELKKQRENPEVSQVTAAEEATASLGLEEQREKAAIVKMKFGGRRAMELKPRPLGRRCQLVALVSLGGRGGIHEAGSPSIGKKTNWNQLLFWSELLLSGGKALPRVWGCCGS